MNDSSEANVSQVVYEFSRSTMLDGWWAWAAVFVVLAAAIWFCVHWYRRDVAELSRPIRWTLLGLRLATVIAIVFFFFDLQRRTERLITRPSEVVVLVDTSQSMSLAATSGGSAQSRADRARVLIAETTMLQNLADSHRVNVYAFDASDQPRLLHSQGRPVDNDRASNVDVSPTSDSQVNPFALFGAFCLLLAGLVLVATLLAAALGYGRSVGWAVLAGATCLVVGLLSLGSVYAVRSDRSLSQILGRENAAPSDDDAVPIESPVKVVDPLTVSDWGDQLAAAGGQSRIGDAVRSVLAEHDLSTLAGVILLTDGQNNGGSEIASAGAAARRNDVSLYPVGLGSSDAPTNVRVVDMDAPKRVYPGDKFSVTAVLQGSGAKPMTVEVQLLDALEGSASGESSDQELGTVVDSQTVEVAADGSLSGIRFELEPDSVGRRKLTIRVVAPADDQNKRDDLRSARYEVVSRKLRVLAIAGGPTREYRFVRNLLFRDKSTRLDVWLQTGQPGMSQDADQLLTEFPETAEALFEYDAIVMFDPDWTELSMQSLDLLDRWLAEQSGGLIVVAGPVYHPKWTRLRTDPRVARIAGFLPVNVSTRGPLLGGGRQGGRNAWPIEFTPDARRAEFLWVADSPDESFGIWDRFGGVYDYVGVKDAKPGATVYGYFSDPTTDVGGSLPVYLASQFYGAGRIMFQGSGEMWRLRGESDSYFDTYYTKLVRWVSEGRLLRDSNRGVLLLDTSKVMVGDTVTVRAVLKDRQFEPLTVPDVTAKLLSPSGRIRDVKLVPQKGEPRAGTYGGRFVVRESGSYELRLTLGDALDEEVLQQSVQVRLPTLELERPIRADSDLIQLATMTRGEFLPMNLETNERDVAEKLVSIIQPQPHTTVLSGTPDFVFGQRRNLVLMWLIGLVLTFEWVVRRLHRLA